MEKMLRGKYMVRKSKLNSGEEVLTITGVFRPTNFDVTEIKDNDEMWVSDIMVLSGGLRFTEPLNGTGVSPEDFLEGDNQSPRDWKNKEKL